MLIRRYEKGDETAIIRLFQKVFKKELPLEVWKWKYQGGTGAPESKIFVAVDNNTVVGHVAVLIFPAIHNSIETNLGLRVDTMVDPEYRGQGLYQRLTNTLITELKETRTDVSYLYGLPAEKAKHVLLHSTEADYLGDLTRKIKINLIKKNKRFYQYAQSGRVLEEINWFDERFNHFEKKKHFLEGITLKRSQDFLNWRYVNNPLNNYKAFAISEDGQIKGYTVLKIGAKKILNKEIFVGFIVDWNLLDEEDAATFKELLQTANNYLYKAIFIQIWEPASPCINNLLKKDLYINKKENINSLVIHNNKENAAKTSFSDWILKMGDVDSF